MKQILLLLLLLLFVIYFPNPKVLLLFTSSKKLLSDAKGSKSYGLIYCFCISGAISNGSSNASYILKSLFDSKRRLYITFLLLFLLF